MTTMNDMETYSVEIRNPQAVKLLQDMAAREMIVLKPIASSSSVLTEDEKKLARERVMRGASSLNIDEMLEWLQESKKDRKLPFRDE
ncbi:hypothetical protein GCM10027592_09890 [Spirosoma flavus]